MPKPKWWIRLFTSPKSTQTSVCFVTWKHKVASCTSGPRYAKTEEIAARKGVIFLHLKERMSVCVCVFPTWLGRVRKSKSACIHKTHMEGKWEREGRKRNWSLICWSQLITFSRPDSRHSSNLWPQPLGPTVLTPQQSTVRDKQAWVHAGHRNRWACGVKTGHRKIETLQQQFGEARIQT